MSSPALEHWRRWVPDLLGGLAVLGLGLVEATRYTYLETLHGPVLAVVGLAVSVGLARLAPSAALAVAWLVGLSHLVTGTNPLATEILFAVVAFGCARWGEPVTLWLSALSIPLSATVLVLWLSPRIYYEALEVAGVEGLAETAYRGAGDNWRIAAALLGIAVLAAPWLAGLAFRYADRARRSRVSQVSAEAARDQAEEIARLREDQARLARDVHDVVGHSLAVILAQAESAQYLPDADTAKLKQTMENIATSARSSLDDVRQVLSATAGQTGARTGGNDLDRLLEGVRASGHDVVSTEYGRPQPLPPELEGVAFRVLQEMLTNALKHGARDRPVRVERHWEGELRIEVQNALSRPVGDTQPVAVARPAPSAGGQGVDGMRRRLESVGGRLDVRRRNDPPTFTATAWLPVRTVAP